MKATLSRASRNVTRFLWVIPLGCAVLLGLTTLGLFLSHGIEAIPFTYSLP